MRGRGLRVLAAVALAATLVSLAMVLVATGGCQVEAPVERASTEWLWLRQEQVTVSATGAAGAATGSGSTDGMVHGRVFAVYVDYTAGITETTDLTLTQASPSMTVLVLADNATDGWYYPTVQVHSTSGSTRAWYQSVLVADQIDIEVGESTSGTVATVTVYWGQ